MRRSPLALALLLGLSAVATPAAAGPAPSLTESRSPSYAAKVPALTVHPIVRHLDHPWDVRSIGRGRLLFTQRDKATLTVWKAGRTHPVAFPSTSVWVSGETGLMGLQVDPDFATNGRIYLCHGGFLAGGGHDVRVDAFHLNLGATRATKLKELVGGFPTSSGRHGGCRLLIASDGSLLVGTGDAAQGTNPENQRSLGGKTLRLNRFTGAPWPTNPFIHADDRNRRYVQSYGHRNVQGLAERTDGTLWDIEQGTYRDDEVNKIVNGGDYGYNPVPGYNESVPMTDQSLPGTQVNARWSSGDPTLAASGGTFLDGKQWGALDGALAVCMLKASRVLFLTFDATGRLQHVRTPVELTKYGRIREAVQAPDGTLLLTTDNGGGEDEILRVTPR